MIASNAAALTEFYKKHFAGIRSYVARRISDPYMVADLTADIFVLAVESAGRYDRDLGTPTAWLYGIARNVVRSEWRRQERDRRLERKLSGRRLLAADDIQRIEEQIDAQREARQVIDAISALPFVQQCLLELVLLDGHAINEAAKAVGLKPATARVYLHRARASLQTVQSEVRRRPTTQDVRPKSHQQGAPT